MPRYVALLRGINVGGNNLIKMTELKACFEKHGFRDVATYIQSGNVLFTAAGSTPAKLVRSIEAAVEKRFGCAVSVVLCSSEGMREIVKRAPKGFGTQPEKYRYDVIFLVPPLTGNDALPSVPTAEGVDRAHAGEAVLYFSRLVEKASRSKLAKLASLPVYKSMTIRNWNTTTKLARLLDESSRAGG